MKTFNQYISLILLLIGGTTFAQEVNLRYTLESQEGKTTVSVFAESNSASSKDIAAFNTSFVHSEGCEAVGKIESLLEESWTDFLGKTNPGKSINVRYRGEQFSRRFQWGIADPGLPQTSVVTVPPKGQPILIMQQTFVGACKNLYMEDVSENSLNELGNTDMKATDYRIIHPNRPRSQALSLQLRAYPVPAVDFVEITPEGFETGEYELEILDMMGRTIFSQSQTFDHSENIQVDIRGLSGGMYIVSLKHSTLPEITVATRIVKE